LGEEWIRVDESGNEVKESEGSASSRHKQMSIGIGNYEQANLF
jgi:hypothetical protein